MTLIYTLIALTLYIIYNAWLMSPSNSIEKPTKKQVLITNKKTPMKRPDELKRF